MLTILALLNKEEIGRVFIHNLGKVSTKGKSKYEAWVNYYTRPRSKKKVIVWHKREDGWMKLTEKVLRKLRKENLHDCFSKKNEKK